MAIYRIYLVHDDGSLEPAESFYCKTDGQALALLDPPARADIRAELWQGGRFIGAARYCDLSGRPGPHAPGRPLN